MKISTLLVYIGVMIYSVGLFSIFRSFKALNGNEKAIAKSINRTLSRKVGQYLVLLSICIIVVIITLKSYSYFIYGGFFLLCMAGQAYQYFQLKHFLLQVDLPDSYTKTTLKFNGFLIVGLAFIVVSFLLKIV